MEDLGVTGDVDQLCIWQWEGLAVRESSLCRIPGGMDQWKDQRLGIAEPREKLELCAAAWVVLK